MTISTIQESGAILAAWQEARSERGRRNRDIAADLGITEATLVASACGAGVTRLRPEWPELLRACERLGRVKGLTRNEHAVIETVGVYRNVEEFGPMGQVLGDGIDLRIFYRRWGAGFAVREPTRRGERRGFQFFATTGVAVHKLFLLDDSDASAYDAIVAEFAAEDQSPVQKTASVEAPPAERPDDEVDVAALREGWLGLQDTHDFHRVLRRVGVTRTQALRLAGSDLAWQVTPGALRKALQRAAAAELPIMIFVGNTGMTQIHSGPVRRIVDTPPWCNVLDPNLDLHVREDGIAQAWTVRKPTRNGVITALELYAEDGEQIALIVSKRLSGAEESGAWRGIIASLAVA